MQVVLNSAGRAASRFKSGESHGVRSVQKLFFFGTFLNLTLTQRELHIGCKVSKMFICCNELKFSPIILFYIVDGPIFEVKIHVTKKPTQIRLLEIIVATPTIGSVIQESNLSKNCLESHETKNQANTTRLLP